MAGKMHTDVPQKYTLSSEQGQFYDKNGYVVVKELIDFTTLYSCKQRFSRICRGVVDKGAVTVMKELALMNTDATGEALVNKMQDILFDDVFATYTEHPRLLDVVSQLIGHNIMAMNSMIINKPPGTSRHPPHQDLHYFPFRPVEKIMAAWTAIDHVNEDNGCLYVIPGSHRKQQLYEHGYPVNSNGTVNKMYHGILEEEKVAPELERVNLEMSPGDTVFFHPLLVHGSGPNLTKGYRKAISSHYAASECNYIQVAGTSHQGIADEVEGVLKKRGIILSFNDLWRARSKLVKGVKCNL